MMVHLPQEVEVPYELGANRRGFPGVVSHLTLQAIGQVISVAARCGGIHGNMATIVILVFQRYW